MDYSKWQKYEGGASTFFAQAAKAEADVGAMLAAYREMPGVKVMQDTVMYNIDTDIPLPPVRIAGAVDTSKYPVGRMAYLAVKPTLLLRAVEPLPGLWMCEARENEDGPRVSTADLGYPLFTSKDGALAFSGDVCAAWWRLHA